MRLGIPMAMALETMPTSFLVMLMKSRTAMAMALDNADAFPTDPNRMKDSNKDNGTKDSDKDGVSDEEDTSPLDPSETQDLDSNGLGWKPRIVEMGWEIMMMPSPTIYLLEPIAIATCGLPLKTATLSRLVAYCNCNNSLVSVSFGSLLQLLLYPFGSVATATLVSSLVDCNCNIIAPGEVQSQYSLLIFVVHCNCNNVHFCNCNIV